MSADDLERYTEDAYQQGLKHGKEEYWWYGAVVGFCVGWLLAGLVILIIKVC